MWIYTFIFWTWIIWLQIVIKSLFYFFVIFLFIWLIFVISIIFFIAIEYWWPFEIELSIARFHFFIKFDNLTWNVYAFGEIRFVGVNVYFYILWKEICIRRIIIFNLVVRIGAFHINIFSNLHLRISCLPYSTNLLFNICHHIYIIIIFRTTIFFSYFFLFWNLRLTIILDDIC